MTDYAGLTAAAEARTVWNGTVGDNVLVAHPQCPGVHRVEKINPRTIIVRDEAGRGAKVDRGMLTATDLPYTENRDLVVLMPGVVVTFKQTPRNIPEGTRFVILATNPNGTFKIAKLGGDNHRYYPKVAGRDLAAVEV